jgi:RNA polymerase sigma factor (sigma-70 family)
MKKMLTVLFGVGELLATANVKAGDTVACCADKKVALSPRAQANQIQMVSGRTENIRESLPGQQPTPGETLAKEERAEIVRRAVASLPEELRVPLVLAEYEDMSHGDIGEILNRSAKAVESRVYRVRKELRKALSILCE